MNFSPTALFFGIIIFLISHALIESIVGLYITKSNKVKIS